MAVRIYALAKELKVDSKELVDICTKAGVPGKGSALASLTEEEVEKVKQFLKGGGTAKAKPAKAAPAAPQRPTEPARAGKMPVIVTPKPAAPARVKPAETVEPDEADEPVEEPEAIETPIAATSTAVETAVAVDTVPPPWSVGRRDGPRKIHRPRRGERQSPSRRRRGETGRAQEGRRRIRRAGTSGREARADAESRGSRARSRPLHEPPAQKPDLRLPADVLGAGKQGAKPLAAHLRRHERTLDEEKKQRGLKGLRAPGTPAPRRSRLKKSAATRASIAAAKEGARAKARKKASRCWAVANSANSRGVAPPTTVGEDDRPQRAWSPASGAGQHRREHGRAAQGAGHRSIAVHGARTVRGGRRAGVAKSCGS